MGGRLWDTEVLNFLEYLFVSKTNNQIKKIKQDDLRCAMKTTKEVDVIWSGSGGLILGGERRPVSGGKANPESPDEKKDYFHAYIWVRDG